MKQKPGMPDCHCEAEDTSESDIVNQIFNSAIDLSPAVAGLLELINAALPASRLDHDLLEMDIPKGALHWGSTEAFPDKHWGDPALRIGADRILVEAKLALRVSSNISTARIVERGWDIENTFSAYEIVGVSLCLTDARQLFACLVSGFYPWSINIRTIE